MQTLGMQKVELRDFAGEPSEFYLSKPGRKFRLRAFSLGDKIWIQQTFGSDVKLETMSADHLCRLAFQMMELEDKREFLAKDVEFINEQGESFIKRLGGPELMYWQVVGLEETRDMLLAIIKSVSGSKVLQEALNEAEKKSQQKLEPSVGMRSSISSQASTAGPQTKSSPVQKKKFRSGSRPYRSARI